MRPLVVFFVHAVAATCGHVGSSFTLRTPPPTCFLHPCVRKGANKNRPVGLKPTPVTDLRPWSSTYASLVDDTNWQEREPENQQERDEGGEGNGVNVKFVAITDVKTPPVPLPPKEKSLHEFFLEHRNLLFAEGAVITDLEDPTEELLELHLRESSKGRISKGLTAHDDTAITQIIVLKNPAMNFIGIKLTSVVHVGTQLTSGIDDRDRVKKEEKHSVLPEYEFTLLTSTFEADGPRPLVWLFNKLMKRNHKEKENGKITDASQQTKISGFTRVMAEPLEDQDGMMVFHVAARLEAQLQIAKLLIRLLPMSLDKLEEQGSATLQNSVEKDTEPAMARFHAAYEEWITR